MELEQTVLQTLHHFPEVQLVVLFGSRANGSNRPDSDVDIAIAALHGPIDSVRFQEIKEALVLSTGFPVDLIDLASSVGPILHESLHYGKVLLGNRTDLHERMILRMTWWQEDEAPRWRAGVMRNLEKSFGRMQT